jgi:hypothetical protein
MSSVNSITSTLKETKIEASNSDTNKELEALLTLSPSDHVNKLQEIYNECLLKDNFFDLLKYMQEHSITNNIFIELFSSRTIPDKSGFVSPLRTNKRSEYNCPPAPRVRKHTKFSSPSPY